MWLAVAVAVSLIVAGVATAKPKGWDGGGNPYAPKPVKDGDGNVLDVQAGSIPPSPQPSGPSGKDDCKKGGYKAYGFKNQGQCIESLK